MRQGHDGVFRRTARRASAAVAALTAPTLPAACGEAGPPPAGTRAPFAPVAQHPGSEITVWADATRAPGVKAYQKAHPGVKVKVVTYSGDANGANDLQTKVRLFDRAGGGWPDVAFSTNYNDAAWATEGRTPYADPLDDGIVRKSTLDGFACSPPPASTAARSGGCSGTSRCHWPGR
ncbi:hypothetical protein [Streptomyces sp. NPDC050560]|uniref:hypothetical protein n=1 Tax=Streptomyces sp. NPDC050560 TaxID=3365630 RepID=UPI0037AFAED0